MKKLIPILFLGLAACATTGKSDLRFERSRGETAEYSISIIERFIGNRCIEREITLKETNGLHVRMDHVRHVRATDYGCDDRFEKFYFRDKRDENVDRIRLTDNLNFLFYGVKYGREK